MKDTLILLHGALGSQKQFRELSVALNVYYNVHSLNFEGHGGNASSNDFSIELFTNNLIDYIQINEIESATIFGYSMGGYVALNAALELPETIKKIVTLGTKFDWSLASAEREVKMLNPDKIEEKIPRFAEKLKQEHLPEDWKEIMTKTAHMMLDMAKGAKLQDTDFLNIKQEVIIGLGSLDAMVTYDESKYVSERIPNSTLVTLEGVKHPIDQIETTQLSDFIKSSIPT